MPFHWNTANIEHIALHNVTPDEAEQVIENDPLDVDARICNGEMRTVHLGETDASRVLFVVITERDGMLRVVTAFEADRRARRFYFDQKAINDDQNTTDP
ncbi:MAG TPA: BrnT family toxin [Acidobacteriaceae bacterium]|jgi:hypothetical protein